MPGYRVMVKAGGGGTVHAFPGESEDSRWEVHERRSLCGLVHASALEWPHRPDCKLCQRIIKGRRLGQMYGFKEGDHVRD